MASGRTCARSSLRNVPELALLDHDTVLAAVSAAAAIDATRDAFLRHHSGEWVMPGKVYVESPPYGDFRAMPARGGDLAVLKWVTSFPGNLAQGLPTVSGVVCLSDARTGVPLAILDARAVTALRTGAVAAVAALALAREDARSVGIVGCGLHGAWTARCLAAAGYAEGVCFDPRADGSGKAEASIDAVLACELFCDEWEQASHGGELAAAVAAGRLTREQVTALGAVLAGNAPGRSSPDATTLFDSTGLAIQDLAVAGAALHAARAGESRRKFRGETAELVAGST
jgi:ornithine cyclodeaminase/alanine dehydrogenase-like protein (mu-crystallin family)